MGACCVYLWVGVGSEAGHAVVKTSELQEQHPMVVWAQRGRELYLCFHAWMCLRGPEPLQLPATAPEVEWEEGCYC